MGCSCTKETLNIENKKYYIQSRIAEGGFGTIDLVEEAKSGRVYALKKVKCDTKNDLEKASLENKYYKQLKDDNANIIKLISDDIIEDKKNPGFVIMSIFPYYKYGNLQTELDFNLKRSIYIKNDRAHKLIGGVCNGLDYIHRSNLAHRDLKPQNILIDDDKNTPVLTDFGSMTQHSIEIDSVRKSQEIQEWAAQNCSMFYKAPELFSPKVGCCVTKKADIWSLGCVLFAILYNKGPFDYVVEKGDSIALAVENVKFTVPTTAIERPKTFLDVIHSTIVYDPNERSDLHKIITDLNEIINFDDTGNKIV